MEEHIEAAVIGAGPAGLMAAEVLARGGARVVVFERMASPARKFLMAGRGGLNLTHSEPFEAFLARYREAAPRLEPALRAFAPRDLRDWAAGLGEDTFVGSSGRVFPKSFKASPLLRAWLRRLAALGAGLRTRHTFLGLGADGALRFATPDGAIRVRAGVSVLALGGASWPRLGADGGWAPALAGLGVKIAPLRPANCGFVAAWTPHFANRFAGRPLKPASFSFAGRHVRGEAIITARGLEGGAIYALSRDLRDAVERDGPALLRIDLRPDAPIAALAGETRAARRQVAGDAAKAGRAVAAGGGSAARSGRGPAGRSAGARRADQIRADPAHRDGRSGARDFDGRRRRFE
jgi:uncharacterized flavoprotein (TIGR03862 family)